MAKRTLRELNKVDEDFELINKKGYPIVKSNELVQRSRSHFTKFQNKLISIICSKIPAPIISHDGITIEPKEIPLDYEITVQEIMQLRGLSSSGDLYNDIKENLKYIRDNSFWIKDAEGRTVTASWLSKVKVNEKMNVVNEDGTKSVQSGDGKIEYSLDPDIVPYISNIVSKYIKYELYDVLELEKEKAIPLFEYLISNAYKKTFIVTYDYLKWMLMLDETDTYKQFKFFNRDVLKPTVQEINEKTSYEVEYMPLGRPVTEIKFLVRKKKYEDEC